MKTVIMKKNPPLSNFQLSYAEQAVELLAKALDTTEKEIVEILKYGINVEIGPRIPKKYKYLTDELDATFDNY